jgi:hypothetical protein
VNNAIHLPLGIHVALSAQGKFIHAFVYGDIAKDRLNTMDGVNVDNAGAITYQLHLIACCIAAEQLDCLFLLSYYQYTRRF